MHHGGFNEQLCLLTLIKKDKSCQAVNPNETFSRAFFPNLDCLFFCDLFLTTHVQ